ncbi:hypothetical protein PsorP6_007371 [Peronosclerospora sorghi]|uniref:Uncharacterized protein n=1 Tax=Peronosclerospora sorghi TaxID=230839 RepID=A0ACC0W766_9STRA|nr:hypothetical protein PsorP6_007371 [Peronosclerospora sorghi]
MAHRDGFPVATIDDFCKRARDTAGRVPILAAQTPWTQLSLETPVCTLFFYGVSDTMRLPWRVLYTYVYSALEGLGLRGTGMTDLSHVGGLCS